jgi:CRISPR-associated protein Cas2
MRDTVHRFIVAYDIALDPRRNRIAKILESYGDRIQYSVFLLDLKTAKMVRLHAALRAHIDTNTDSILICDLGPIDHGGLSRISFVGLQRTITGQGPLIL